ncbi:hypothetical protein [Methanoplanus limicola]|nr:hypothetical protein [Methanoplanus limicola]
MAAYNIVRPKYSGDRRLRAAATVDSGKPVSSFTGNFKVRWIR